MKALGRMALSLAIVTASLAPCGSAFADAGEYGIKTFTAQVSDLQAGAHPDFVNSFQLRTVGEEGVSLPSTTEKSTFDLPPGLIANPLAVPMCTTAQLIGSNPEVESNETGCPQDSQVGLAEVELSNGHGVTQLREPVFNMVPGPGEPARLGFFAKAYPALIRTEVDVARRYAVTARVEGLSSLISLLGATTTLWGVPADESHDVDRISVYEANTGGKPKTETGRRPSGLVPVPFTRNPTRCGDEQGITLKAFPYAAPEDVSSAFAAMEPNTGCSLLNFEPDLSLAPTQPAAGSGSGLDADLTFPQGGFEHPNLLAEADQKRAEVILPEGVTINSSQANGLGACTEAQLEAETATSPPGGGCPEDSKVGTVTAKTPLLEEEAEGSLYVATPYQNPYGSLIALYMVLKVPDRGVVVKLPGKVSINPATGQITTVFGEGGYPIPQLPVSSFHLHFREGPRAPLVMPETCGSYEATATFTSWGGQEATSHPAFTIDRGPEGGPCPTGPSPFGPAFTARSTNLRAGAFSPLFMRFTRKDGEAPLTRLSAKLPEGLLAKLADVAECPDFAIEAARARTGIGEQVQPSCPAGSLIGHLQAGAGVGATLTWAEGSLYLAGPYRGAPLSVAAIVPAVAGPFDLGTVVTREPLRIDPETAIAEADGSAEPIPTILQGIPLRLRDLRLYLDRPDFTLNPTSCDPLAFQASFISALGSSATASSPFQVADCATLPFQPKLSLRLKGGTKRSGHPELRATLTAKGGTEANISRVSVALPHSEFLDQGNIGNVCTRPQFAAVACPANSLYGHVRAFTPLLDEPLEGNVYLRSNGGERLLPDLVADLRGRIHIVLVGHVDSFHQGIRTTFEGVPDAPVTKFVLRMPGGRHGLLVNSTDLCRGKHRAGVRMLGQNGKRHNFQAPLQARCR
jgi:hypothetical protein